MTRPILAVLVLAISIPPLYAQGTILQTDRSGYTTGIDGNRTVNTYTDRYGNTTGWIGGKYISTYGDGYGGTTGTIGNKPISTYGDGYGYTRGTIGRDQVNTYTDRSGFTTGTIGRRRVNCFTDPLRTTKCYSISGDEADAAKKSTAALLTRQTRYYCRRLVAFFE